MNIIKILSDEKIYSFIFSDNHDILDAQIKNDKEKIKKLFSSFEEKMKKKQKSKEKDIMQSVKKGTQYVIKETENLKEIEVTIKADSDLKSVIEQDF